MNCAQCGSKVSQDDKFCEQCGKPISKNIQKSEPAKALVKKSKKKKAGIIAGSVVGSIIAVAVLAFFLLNFFNFSILQFLGFEDDLWQYDKKIKQPITAVSADEDATLGQLETHGVSVDIPAQTFDSHTSVTLSHPEKKPGINRSEFEPLGAPVTIDSTGQQKRLNKPVRVTLSIDSLERNRSGALYIANLNERNTWDYIVPDEIDLEKKLVTFKTHHLGTFGFVNLTKEKLVQEVSRQRSVRQWTERSLEFEAAQARDEILREILQERLSITDTTALEALKKAVAKECPADKLAVALVNRDAASFTNAVVESAKRNIPKTLEPMILKEALENTAGQPWAEDISDAVAEILKEGNLTQATIKVIDEVASEFIIERVEKVWVDLADRKISVWNNPEIEKSYQVFKGGTQEEASLWGYKAKAGNFEELWGQMRGVAEDVVDREIASYARANNKKLEDLVIEEKNKISQDAKLNLKKQFEERVQQEAEIARIENNNINIAGLLTEKGLLAIETSNPSFKAEDDLGSLINRIYVKIEEIKIDIGRFEVIFEEDEATEIEKYDPETIIEADELVELVYIYYEKGEEAYRQAVEQKDLIKEEAAVVVEEDVIIEVINMSLDGRWIDDAGTGIEINGSTGVFYSFSPNWQRHADAGLISLGDLAIKDIEQIGDVSLWNCLVLWRFVWEHDNTPSKVAWSDSGLITMLDDGSRITIISKIYDPGRDEVMDSGPIVYYRVTDEQDLQEQDTQEQDTQTQETEEQDTQDQDTQTQETSKQDEQTPEVNMSLIGKWSSNGWGFEIRFFTGTFYSVEGWEEFVDAGLVKVGDLKIKNIEQISSNQWSCLELWYYYHEEEPFVGWSDNGTITMSEDGKSITIESTFTHPNTGESYSSPVTYHRITD